MLKGVTEAPGMGAAMMPLERIREQLESIRDNAAAMHDPEEGRGEWEMDVQAVDAALLILAALGQENVADAEGARDMVADYRSLAKQYRAAHQKYEVPSKPKYRNGEAYCPECGRFAPDWVFYCGKCGKRIGR